jgi:hypothetical protein
MVRSPVLIQSIAADAEEENIVPGSSKPIGSGRDPSSI